MSTPRLATIFAAPALLALFTLPPSTVAAQRATVFGTVYDSLNERPLAGARVQMASSDLHGGVRDTRTDAHGRFRIDRVRPGEYIVGFTHPLLDSLGLEPQAHTVSMDEKVAQVEFSLAIPSTRSIRAQLCPATTVVDSSGLMLGYLRDADTGIHLDSGAVILEWTEVVVGQDGIHAERKAASARATSTGWYAVCGLSTAGPISARAELGKSTTGYIDVRVPPRAMLHRDFRIPIGDAAIIVTHVDGTDASDSTVVKPGPVRIGTAALSGIVRDAQGKPLDGARVMVWGSGSEAATHDDGRFSVTGLPAGTQTVEARYVGYTPTRMTVDLVSGQTVAANITMSEHTDVLDEVTVYGAQRQLQNDLAGFNQRRALGFGHFITRADIEKKRPLRFTDLLRATPGLRLVATGELGYAIVAARGSMSGGACRPLMFINGVALTDPEGIDTMVDPQEVAAIEIYSGVGETPPQFRGGLKGECGSVAIWTVPNLPGIGARP